MGKQLENKLCFVQFLHPGGEHRPNHGLCKAWNRGGHKRKFMAESGRCVQHSKPIDTELVFWGEWEPESGVVCEFAQSPPLPRYLNRPFYVVRDSYQGLQNTDPFVFGGFFYGNCRQRRNGGDTQLRYLDRGSVILFGSRVSHKFVLDTVFVVRDWVDYDRDSYMSVLKGCVPPPYVDVVVRPLFDPGRGRKGSCPPHRGKSCRLYIAATYTDRYEGNFSFFPCMPRHQCTNGFERPVICIPRLINGSLARGFRLNCQSHPARVHDLRESVIDQVLEQGLWLGIYAEIARCRHATR